jgi:hypothetical protein
LDLNFNANEPQQLEAIQCTELMLSNLFFLVVLVILFSKIVDFGLSLLLADGLTGYRRPGPVRPPPTSIPTGGNDVEPFRPLC